MTAAEFNQCRATLGLTQIALAEYLGVSSRQIKRYESGACPIPTPTALLIEAVEKKQRPKIK
tara:strand:+ start:752 stop:937 length:186 start_codon:yes stop_codon:yes gene_type:complete